MKSIKEKAREHSLEPRANVHCGYDEEDLENSFEAGANYVLDEIEKVYNKEGLVMVLDLIEQLKREITMTQEEKILVDKYLVYETAEKEARSNRLNILKELATLAPHKVGEVAKWTEYKTKNVGTFFYPKYENLPPVEKNAVVTRVIADVLCFMTDGDPSLHYKYEFKSIKKDGTISQNQCHPNNDTIEWTGKVYDLNKE